MHSILSLLSHSKTALEAALGLDPATARSEARSLLQAVLQVDRAWLIAHDREVVAPEHQARFDAGLARRLAGEPLAYILGEREFFGLDFKVTPATLIPRADTELLVELALQRQSTSVLDLGTGSGAVALSIAHARPDALVTAVDASAAALAVARENAVRLGLLNVALVESDWFAALAGRTYDLIVSNPPYIAADDPHLVQGDLPFEPASALASGADGLDDIRRIVAAAPDYLRAGGELLLEHGYDQADRVRSLLEQRGFGEVRSFRDLAGIERVTGGRWPA
ncbi:peptide chain release factor N(5)-glutamine methyltransferase [Ferriphaselus sp. R-1]|uniref:peptide chain release factor N(5)-glutamine methyltransferase n=1 Tax=Ferriphaselus sp. R-1 TaxID=1485544 RepID=UPI000AFAE35E|nr:peptide chain release factor N(5)-glutamine methyltransferase [Ferriphaselus sp. R-1]